MGAYSFSPTSRWATLQLCTRERTTSPLVSHLAIRFSNPRICNKICNEMKRNPLYSPRFAILKGEEDNFFHHNFPFPQAEDLYLTILVESGRRRHPLPLSLRPNHVQRNVFEFEQTGGSLGIRLGAHRSSRGIIQGGEASRRNPDERHFSYILHPSLC